MVTENYPNIQQDLALCICTYKRSALLKQLLIDILAQTIQPGTVIIVDGDPQSGEVLKGLKGMIFFALMKVYYVASNHGNQTYQRYLGWRMAQLLSAKKMIYLDDDLRIEQPDSIQNIVAPLDWPERNVVAVTGSLDMGIPSSEPGALTLTELRSGLSPRSKIIAWFGTSRNYLPGEVTPAGNRIPLVYQGSPYEPVQWLRGGAIAFKVNALSEKVLSDDIFAMNHRRFGLCEDLIISRRLVSSGELLFAFNAVFRHPSEDPPKAYSSKAYDLAFAIAYSRKWFNDNYRGSSAPKLSDRLVLAQYYLAALFVNTIRALASFNSQRVAFVYGLLRGIAYSFYKEPSAQSLTPNIDWWSDAEKALLQQVMIK